MIINETAAMKNFSHPKQENQFGSRGSMSHPQINRGSFENVRLRGTSVGASMVAEGGSGESCSINIYINNDIQGINNSVLLGSEVRMGDPGVSLCLEGLKMDRGLRLVTNNKGADSTHFILLFAFLILIVSVSAYFSV